MNLLKTTDQKNKLLKAGMNTGLNESKPKWDTINCYTQKPQYSTY